MPDAISAVSNVQLSYLQSPEIAREQIPITAESELASAQAASLTAKEDEQANEAVQQLEQAGSSGVPDALTGQTERQLARERERRRRQREPVTARAVPLAAAHPRGLGSMVDFRA